uniref:Calcineurin-like phosphoesterase domain-containing protein n=1 Tax=viral metagenome TaxID=1070528 RepID=A0A6C0BDJ2_9ZZZZ
MRFQLFSDIHTEIVKNNFPKIPPKSDHLILGGDIGKVTQKNFKDFIKYCSENWKTVIFVFGNHEFYGGNSMESINQKTRDFFSEFSNVYLLDNSSIVIDDVTIYGFTAWTPPIFDSTTTSRNYLNDYNMIKTRNGRFNVDIHREICEDQVMKFREFIETTESDKIIIVTHFPPIRDLTSNPIYNGEICNNYFAWNDLLKDQEILTDKIKIWCSGHTHWSYDFIRDNIRYISNQVGYKSEGVIFSLEGEYELI